MKELQDLDWSMVSDETLKSMEKLIKDNPFSEEECRQTSIFTHVIRQYMVALQAYVDGKKHYVPELNKINSDLKGTKDEIGKLEANSMKGKILYRISKPLK